MLVHTWHLIDSLYNVYQAAYIAKYVPCDIKIMRGFYPFQKLIGELSMEQNGQHAMLHGSEEGHDLLEDV